jgi:hypothetical protein
VVGRGGAGPGVRRAAGAGGPGNRGSAVRVARRFRLRIWRGFDPKRSGEIQLVARGQNVVGAGFPHAGPQDHFQEVPRFLYGPGIIAPRVVDSPVTSADIAPTQARLVGTEPGDVDGAVAGLPKADARVGAARPSTGEAGQRLFAAAFPSGASGGSSPGPLRADRAGILARMDEGRFYTVEEANAGLDELRETLTRIREARRTVLASAERITRRAPSNGGGLDGTAHWEALRVLRQDVESLSARGIVLRDAETGLVDFPARREGRLVYLCWRPDEDRVAHWHEVDTGFGGRRPLDV